MSRAKRNRLPPFVAIPWKILNSQAYKSLKASSAKALPYFLGKPHRIYKDPQYTADSFIFPYSEAEKYGFAPATFSNVIKDLIAHGFIDPVEKGGLRGHGRTCSRFKLSYRWELFGTAHFQECKWESFV